ncbi:MAG TPA: hypothetical protein VGZ47_18050 [Gemmataceae bacterium]|jgi:MoxR-like ATPase|nr:hypothetical protein [Gemmataceae bacterium]
MSNADSAFSETITLKQAKALIQSLACRQSLLLLSPPGVGKSDIVAQAERMTKLAMDEHGLRNTDKHG